MSVFRATFDTFGLALVTVVFVIVLVVCLRVLPKMGFGGLSGKVLALCVAVLSSMGLIMLGPQGPANRVSAPWPDDYLLLPYAALGLTLLLLPFIFLIDWCLRTCKEHSRQKCKPSQSTKESHASPLPKPQAVRDGKKVRRTACGDRQRIHGADRDRLQSEKRRFKQ